MNEPSIPRDLWTLRWTMLLTLVPGVLVATAGCTSYDALYKDVRMSRVRAYRQWETVRANRRQSETLLEGKLILSDAIKLSLVHNKSLQAIVQEKEIARGRVVASYSEVLPTVSAVGSYTRLDEVPSFDVGGQSVSLGFVDNYSLGLRVRQPLYRGGGIRAALRAAKLFSYLSDERVRARIQATIYETARAYYDALLAERLFGVNEDAVRSARMHLADVKKKRTEGVASDFDVLRAQVDVSNFQAEMIRQKNRIHLSKTRLLKSMGVSQDSRVDLVGKLTRAPLEAEQNLERAVRTAYGNRPDLYLAELGVRLQQEALKIAHSRYWPQLSAVLSQGWSRPDPHSSTSDEWGDAWSVGIVAEWPLFDGLRREGQVIQEKAALRQRHVALLNAQEQTLLEIQQALLSLQDAGELVASQRLNLDRAKEGHRLARVGYRAGVNTEVEVVDARAALTRTRGLYYQAIYSQTIARLELQRAMGILGPRAGDRMAPAGAPVRPAHVANPSPHEPE